MQGKESENNQSPVAEGVPAGGRAALLQKFRLPLLIIGGLVLALLLLLGGMAIGTAKRSADIKHYQERVAAANKQVEDVLNEQKLLEVKLQGMSESLKLSHQNEPEKKKQLEMLQEKLACYEQAAAQAQAEEQAASSRKQQERGKSVAEEKKGYVRFGNTSCTLSAGGSSAGWKSCLNLGQPAGGGGEQAVESGAPSKGANKAAH